MDYIFEIFKTIPRQGPGSEASTLRALSYTGLPGHPRVLDLGCGTGYQTLTLARGLRAEITALDFHQPYLDILWHLAYHLDTGSEILTTCQSMADPELPAGAYDLLWSEGAIYNIGFENGLSTWRKFLKPGGFIAVTEVSWFREDAPAEPAEFWQREYPDIKTVAANLEIIERLGYRIAGHFPLPESDWWVEFYTPLLTRVSVLKQEAAGDIDKLTLLGQIETEIEIYRRYSAYYGYTFYIMQKA